jgi:hypothetical protein
MKRFFTYVPKNVLTSELVGMSKWANGPHKEAHGDSMAYIIGLLSYLPLVYDDITKESGHVILNAERLKDAVGSSYIEYLRILQSAGVIECDESYQEGKTSMGYKFSTSFEAQPLCKYEFTSLKMRKHFLRRSEANAEAKKKYKYLWRWFNDSLTIDEDAALKLISAKNWNMANAHAIDAVANRNWRFSVDKTGYRLHTVLTNMKKDFRALLRYNGEKLIELDVASSQPYFSILMLNEHIKSKLGTDALTQFHTPHKPTSEEWFTFLQRHKLRDMADYVFLIGMGLFYIHLYDRTKQHLRGKYIEEDDTRKKAFFLAFYGRPDRKTPARKALELEFPETLRVFDALKSTKYQDLAITLQRYESDAILNRVCGRIAKEHKTAPIFTIHDSILTTERYAPDILRIMNDELTDMVGVKPKIRRKNY